MNEKEIKSFILKELEKFNLKKYTKGYKYLVECIYICILNEDYIDNLTKNVFPKIAQKYNEKSYLNIKWCINQVINTMYNNTKIDIISKYFNLDYNLKPSLKFIVYTIMTKYTQKI